jgi:multisubunit Na+/H+ antiporter MnhE subunit
MAAYRSFHQRTGYPFTILSGIILGMLFKFFYDWLFIRGAWDWKEFGLSAILALGISIILYGTVLDKIGETHNRTLILSVAFTTGFTWQSIIEPLIRLAV